MSEGPDGRWVLAIDFGTSNTTAAVCTAGTRPKELLFRLEPRLPSAVLLAPDGRFAIGSAAVAQKASASDRYVDTPKRQVGKGSTVLGGTPVTDESLVAAIYEAVYSEGVRQAGGAAPDLVALTHPAAWQPGAPRCAHPRLRPRPSISRRGGRRAGGAADRLSRSRLPRTWTARPVLPTAPSWGSWTAAAAPSMPPWSSGSQGDYRILGRAEGIDPLGGVDFDHALLGHVMQQLPELAQRLSLPSQTDADALLVLLDSIRVAKESLSENATVVVRVPPFPPELPDAADIQVTRDEFRRLIAGDLDRAAGLLKETAARSAAGRSLDTVFLIGGTSRIPALAGAVAERLGTSPQEFGDPQLAVSLGAAEMLRRSWTPAERLAVEPGLAAAATAVMVTAQDAVPPTVTPAVDPPGDLNQAAADAPAEDPASAVDAPAVLDIDAEQDADPSGATLDNPPRTAPARQWSAFTKGAIAGAVVAVVGLIVFAFSAGGESGDSGDSGDGAASSSSLVTTMGGAATDEACDTLTADDLTIFSVKPTAGALCAASAPTGTTGFTLLAVDDSEISAIARQVDDAKTGGTAIEQSADGSGASRMALVCTEGQPCGWIGYVVGTNTEFRITTTLTDPVAATDAMAGYSILPGEFLTKA